MFFNGANGHTVTVCDCRSYWPVFRTVAFVHVYVGCRKIFPQALKLHGGGSHLQQQGSAGV